MREVLPNGTLSVNERREGFSSAVQGRVRYEKTGQVCVETLSFTP